MKTKSILNTLIIFSFCITTFAIATPPFKFQLDKEHDGHLSLPFLKNLASFFRIETFVETGTFSGNTTAEAARVFRKVYTVELGEKMYKAAAQKFIHTKNVYTYHDNSVHFLVKIIPTLNDPVIFWLDAHYCGVGTARGDSRTPIKDELDTICRNHNRYNVILIDDIRAFGTRENNREYKGYDAYPFLNDVCVPIKKIWPTADIKLIGDKLIIYDAEIYGNIPASPIVVAATKSRLTEFLDVSDFDLIEAEKIIANAHGSEKDLLQCIYKCRNLNDLHCYLWYALVMLKNGEADKALIEFKRIIDKGYNHWRVYWYAAQAAYKTNNNIESLKMLDKVLEKQASYKPVQTLRDKISKIR